VNDQSVDSKKLYEEFKTYYEARGKDRINFANTSEKYFTDTLKIIIPLATGIMAFLSIAKEGIFKSANNNTLFFSFIFLGISMIFAVITFLLISYFAKGYTDQAVKDQSKSYRFWIEGKHGELNNLLQSAIDDFKNRKEGQWQYSTIACGCISIITFFLSIAIIIIMLFSCLYEGKTINIGLSQKQLQEKQHIPLYGVNLLKNGDFSIPFKESTAWGHGYYSNKIKENNPNLKFVWINFLDTNISISVVSTIKGNALKIENKSNAYPNRVGIMEQYIVLEKGLYKLSFWAKADKLAPDSIQFTTANEWLADPERGGYELKQKGPFPWTLFEKEIRISKGGKTTFTLASKSKGIIYIADIKLVKLTK